MLGLALLLVVCGDEADVPPFEAPDTSGDAGAADAGQDTTRVEDTDGEAPDLGQDLALGDLAEDADDAASQVDVELDSDPASDVVDETADLTDEEATVVDRYEAAIFRATHNSYSGGERRSIREQLDSGVRFVELDVHDDDYEQHGYRVGHDSPGGEVDHSGDNPEDDGLESWLRIIAQWSDANPDHAPITLGLDLKDDLTDNESFDQGNLAALNALLTSHFGDKLVEEEGLVAWPPLEELRGRVIVVLSGNHGTRQAYRRESGFSPAVSINAGGQVVEVHSSGVGDLWYWTGAYQQDGAVSWQRHGKHDTGRGPTVSLNNEGWVVEVHSAPLTPTLWARVGRLDDDGELAWEPSVEIDTGSGPRVRFTDKSGLAIEEMHQGTLGLDTWVRTGVLDTESRSIVWDGPATETDLPIFETDRDTAGDMEIRVWSELDGATPSLTTLHYATPGRAEARIRYRNLAFVERQRLDLPALANDGLFFAASSVLDSGWALDRREEGMIVRIWQVNAAMVAVSPLPHFPATDFPFEDWYLELTTNAIQ